VSVVAQASDEVAVVRELATILLGYEVSGAEVIGQYLVENSRQQVR
jgi:hypothetical protein